MLEEKLEATRGELSKAEIKAETQEERANALEATLIERSERFLI